MIPDTVNHASYDRKLAQILCRASSDAYRPASELGMLKDWWLTSFIDLIEVDDTEVLCFSDADDIILAFRGTSSAKDILTDTTARRSIWHGLSVHEGFVISWNSVKAAVQEWCDDHGYWSKRLYVTGHSLGGALATLCAFEFDLTTSGGLSPYLCTFGSPRVGGRAFAKDCDRQLAGRHYRVTHGNDVVPLLPMLFRANCLLPDWLPLVPTLRPLFHCGEHIHVHRNGAFGFTPVSDHFLTRYQEAI